MNGAFRRWLIGDMGTGGDFDFTPIHYWTMAAVVAMFLLFLGAALLLRKHPKQHRWILLSVSLFQLGFTTKSEGHGSGLNIVSEIMEAYGGKISVESNSEITRFTGNIPKPSVLKQK